MGTSLFASLATIVSPIKVIIDSKAGMAVVKVPKVVTLAAAIAA